MILLCNSSFIPLLIDTVAEFEGHATLSAKQIAIMKKNFFYMMINTIFIPLTSMATVGLFL